MAAAIESSILNAAAFNGIKAFEEQNDAVDMETLKAIAAIFVEHNMQAKLGAGLLHRHEKLQEGSVMLHEAKTTGADVCLPKALSSVDVTQMTPHSWFLNREGLFQAFEYDASGEMTELKPAFAIQLGNFLKAHGLEDRISIIPNPAGRGDSIEFIHPGGSGTIRVTLHLVSKHDIDGTEPVVTGWSFHVNGHGVIECKGNDVCAPKKNGNRQVFQDSKPFKEVKAM